MLTLYPLIYHGGMQCNIDARGKRVRLTAGIVMAAAGVGIIAANLMGWLPATQIGNAMLYLGIGLLAAGAFAIFEGWAGWCAMRAMGFKTRL